MGKNDGSHTSSKTIVACFTTADLTPALIIPHNVHCILHMAKVFQNKVHCTDLHLNPGLKDLSLKIDERDQTI